MQKLSQLKKTFKTVFASACIILFIVAGGITAWFFADPTDRETQKRRWQQWRSDVATATAIQATIGDYSAILEDSIAK